MTSPDSIPAPSKSPAKRGPKTAKGKLRSSLNALKHGRYATNAALLRIEDAAAFEDLVAAYCAHLDPQSPMEYNYVRDLAAIDHRLARISAIEAGILDQEMAANSPLFDSSGQPIHPHLILAKGADSFANRSRLPAYLSAMQGRLMYSRSVTLTAIKQLKGYVPPSAAAAKPLPAQPLTFEEFVRNEFGTNSPAKPAHPIETKSLDKETD
jgi:hypothetical protein